MKELRVGLIGCGGIGAVHARSWQQVEGARIVAACDADVDKARALGSTPYGAAGVMFAQEALDVVDICTPPNLHPELAIEALRKGLPVVCEKPLARNVEEARAIVSAAAGAGVPLMTAFCHRFHPPIQLVKRLIDEGQLGRIFMFRNRFGGLLRGMESRWFSNREIAGGGTLLDTSIHSVDLFRFLVGEVATVKAETASYNPAIREVEDSAVMLLTAENGALGVIEGSWSTPWSANVVEIYGEAGAAVVDYDTGETRYRLSADEQWTRPDTGDGDRFVNELRHFASVVRGEAPLKSTAEDGLRAVEIVCEAYAASARRA